MRTGQPYTGADLRRDALAGVLLSALLVPAGMGYAEVAGLPPSTGLHATVAALVAYALVGPSRILVVGPDSAPAPLFFANRDAFAPFIQESIDQSGDVRWVAVAAERGWHPARARRAQGTCQGPPGPLRPR